MRGQLQGLGTGFRRLLRWTAGRPAVALEEGCTHRELGEPGFDVFFGYYDVTPFGPDDGGVLAVRRPARGGSRTAGTPLELGLYDLQEDAPRFRRFDQSTAWCWQQGCRLQWWRDGRDGKVLYNRTHDGRHEAVVQNVHGGAVEARIGRPLYSVSRDGSQGVSLNFPRLQRLRPGYGYADLEDPFASDPRPSRDGLWLVDLNTGRESLLLSLAEVAGYSPEDSMAGATHYFNHVLWSPAASRFFFLHLWQPPHGRRRSRAFVWDMASGQRRHLGARDHFSHHWWLDEDRLLAYSTHDDTGRAYHLYDLAAGTRRVFGRSQLTEDGHPSVSPVDGRVMVTDTYPDRALEQHLLLYDLAGDRVLPAGRFFSPPAYRGETRCDLHPRWSRKGHLLAVDSAHRGERRLCIVDVAPLLRAKGLHSEVVPPDVIGR